MNKNPKNQNKSLEERAAELLKKTHDALNKGDMQLMYQYHKEYLALYQKPGPEKKTE